VWREPAVIVLVLASVLLLIVFPLATWLRERRRRKAMKRLASHLGLRYRAQATSPPRRTLLLDALLKAARPFASNILSGTFEGHPVWVFDHYPAGRPVWGHEGTENSPVRTCLVLEHGGRFPELGICPRTRGSKLAQSVANVGIEFESAEFSGAFFVHSADRKFAYDVCHPRLMAFLLEHPDLYLEFREDSIVLLVDTHLDKRLPVEEIPRRLKQLVEIRKLLPKYLFGDAAEGR